MMMPSNLASFTCLICLSPSLRFKVQFVKVDVYSESYRLSCQCLKRVCFHLATYLGTPDLHLNFAQALTDLDLKPVRLYHLHINQVHHS